MIKIQRKTIEIILNISLKYSVNSYSIFKGLITSLSSIWNHLDEKDLDELYVALTTHINNSNQSFRMLFFSHIDVFSVIIVESVENNFQKIKLSKRK